MTDGVAVGSGTAVGVGVAAATVGVGVEGTVVAVGSGVDVGRGVAVASSPQARIIRSTAPARLRIPYRTSFDSLVLSFMMPPLLFWVRLSYYLLPV
jgi:hypothetical protein